ncbi:MAG: hypothetical protein Q8L14_13340 [Myxococcales bacterium]|nr:hypothetical protein [Myxococcales bacterium]
MRVKALSNIHEPDSDGCEFLNFSEGSEYVVCTVYDDCYRLVDDKREPVLARKDRFEIIDPVLPDWVLSSGERRGPGMFLVPGFFESWHDRDERFRALFELEYQRLLSFDRGRRDAAS